MDSARRDWPWAARNMAPEIEHFFGFALYLDRSRDARPLPRGLTGHVAHPLRSIPHCGLPGGLLCAALGKPGRLLRNPLRTNIELRARVRRMRPSLTFSISLIIAVSLHTAIAQSSPTPAPTPVTLRSLLLSELHSTHDNAEWFTPIKAAVAGLTAEQAKWVPQNAQGKIDSER